MKVALNVKEDPSKEIKYPCLMVDAEGAVVLFHRAGRGVVVSPCDMTKVGDYSGNWQMCYFKPFHGTVTLSNE